MPSSHCCRSRTLVVVFLGAELLLPCVSRAESPPRLASDRAQAELASAVSESQPNTLTLGKRIRVTSTALRGRTEGLVQSIDDKALTIASKKKGTHTIPWSAVSRLEVQTGYRRPVLEMMLGGAAVGALISLLVPLDETCNTPEQRPSDVCSRAKMAAYGAAGFGVLNLGVVFLMPPERYDLPKWQPLAPPFYHAIDPGRVSVRLTPVKAGIVAQVTLRF